MPLVLNFLGDIVTNTDNFKRVRGGPHKFPGAQNLVMSQKHIYMNTKYVIIVMYVTHAHTHTHTHTYTHTHTHTIFSFRPNMLSGGKMFGKSEGFP